MTTLIIFDMDGVLIDVSGSYRETVRQTAKLFFEGAKNFDRLPDPLFSLSDLAAVKRSGGLNNDWDLTCAVLNLLATRVEIPDRIGTDAWRRFRETIDRCDLSGLARYLVDDGGSLAALMASLGRPQHPFIQKMYRGDVGTGNIIKQIFQEIYLGGDLFRSTYGSPPKIHTGDGAIAREKLLAQPKDLAHLSDRYELGIATGRPGNEALWPLEHFGIGKYFSIVYSLDDCLREEDRIFKEKKKKVSRGKPHPFMLDAIADQLGLPFDRYCYIGDMPDDMMAAKRSNAGYTAVGMLASSPEKENLKKDLLRAGADFVIDDFSELTGLLDAETA